ncbi:hypothetical protein NL676_028880 [Syzygium grande]|nr:hypothetical protein NL676_028880 [Syzygium grande]
MINSANGMASSVQAPSSSSSANVPPPGLKTYFKTPEGQYKLQYEKGHPFGLIHYVQGKTVTQVLLPILFCSSPPPLFLFICFTAMLLGEVNPFLGPGRLFNPDWSRLGVGVDVARSCRIRC